VPKLNALVCTGRHETLCNGALVTCASASARCCGAHVTSRCARSVTTDSRRKRLRWFELSLVVPLSCGAEGRQRMRRRRRGGDIGLPVPDGEKAGALAPRGCRRPGPTLARCCRPSRHACLAGAAMKSSRHPPCPSAHRARQAPAPARCAAKRGSHAGQQNVTRQRLNRGRRAVCSVPCQTSSALRMLAMVRRKMRFISRDGGAGHPSLLLVAGETAACTGGAAEARMAGRRLQRL